MRFLLVMLVLLLCLCKEPLDPKNYNFSYGTSLAIQQDSLLKEYHKGKIPPKSYIDSMDVNKWIWLSYELAPNNLVIRQLCLLDMFRGKPFYRDMIYKQLYCLSYGDSSASIWAEGYSYWQYTRAALDLWVVKFRDVKNIHDIENIINKIDQGFVGTAYRRGIYWYPAPVGDVRDEPLSTDLQILCNEEINSRPDHGRAATVSFQITDSSIMYFIQGKPVGLNLHIPMIDDTVEVINGEPRKFNFYKGYAKKYLTKVEEIEDMLNLRRVNSIGQCK